MAAGVRCCGPPDLPPARHHLARRPPWRPGCPGRHHI